MNNEVKLRIKIRSDQDFTERMNIWYVKDGGGNWKYKMMNGE